MTILSTNSATIPNLNTFGHYTVKKGDSQTYKVEKASNLIFKSHIPEKRTSYYDDLPLYYYIYYNLNYQSGALINAKVLSTFSNSTGRGAIYNISYVTPGYINKTYYEGPILARIFGPLNVFVWSPSFNFPFGAQYIYPSLNSSDIQTLQDTYGANNVTVKGDNITLKTYSDPLIKVVANGTDGGWLNPTIAYYYTPFNLTYTFNYQTGWLEYFSFTNIYLNSTSGYNYYVGDYTHYFNTTQQLILSILPQSSSSHKGLPGLTVLSVLPPLAVLVVITMVKRKVRK